MKNVFAILFSVLLIAGQTAFMAQANTVLPQSGITKSCVCAHCLKPCCVSKTTPASQPSPAAPIRTASQTNWQPLLSAAQLLLEQPEFAASRVPSFDTLVSSPNLIPLYSRNCSYLI